MIEKEYEIILRESQLSDNYVFSIGAFENLVYGFIFFIHETKWREALPEIKICKFLLEFIPIESINILIHFFYLWFNLKSSEFWFSRKRHSEPNFNDSRPNLRLNPFHYFFFPSRKLFFMSFDSFFSIIGQLFLLNVSFLEFSIKLILLFSYISVSNVLDLLFN